MAPENNNQPEVNPKNQPEPDPNNQPEVNSNNQPESDLNNQPEPDLNNKSETNPTQTTPDPALSPELVAIETAKDKPTNGNFNPMPFASPKKSRKKLFIIIAAALLVLLVGTGVAAWVWYSSPGKVLGDASRNLLSDKLTGASGSFSFTPKEAMPTGLTKLNGTFSSKLDADKNSQFGTTLQLQADDKTTSFDASVVTAAGGDVYVKVGQLEPLLDEALSTAGLSTEQKKLIDKQAAPLLEKVDGKWIKLPQSKLNSLSPVGGTGENDQQVSCVQDAMEAFYTDKAQQDEVLKAYQENQVLTLESELGSKTIDGHDSLGYSLKPDESKADGLMAALKETQLFKKLEACGLDMSSQGEEAGSEQTTATLEVWVDRWSHDFTQFNLKLSSQESDVELLLKPNFDNYQTVEIPSQAVAYTEIEKDIQSLIMTVLLIGLSNSLQQEMTTLNSPTFESTVIPAPTT